MFVLDVAFEASSQALSSLPLCEARLHLDARFPWLVLIPRIAEAREIEDLSESDRTRLMAEIVDAGRAIRAMGQALNQPVEKLNVGALGNITPQLHIHVIGRRANDPAWPGPAWGFGQAEPYAPGALATALAAARNVLWP